MQKVIRTYPKNWSRTTEMLQEALSEGYEVVMCNPVYSDGKKVALEYIVEKKGKLNK